MNKAFVSIIEMIIIVGVLLIAFNILFPGFFYQNRWEDAFISLKGRDAVITSDRIGKLYEYSFNESALGEFLDRTTPTNLTSLIHWSGDEGAFKPTITVACNCTQSQIGNLTDWVGRLKYNGRIVDLDIVTSSLDAIHTPSDVLLISGYKDLTNYKKQLLDYLGKGSGIIELMDFQGANEINAVQNEIFGIAWDSSQDNINNGNKVADFDQFVGMPQKSTNATYKPYKYFFNLTKRLAAPANGAAIGGCNNPPPKGVFTMNNSAASEPKANYTFWICTPTSVWFDTNADNTADKLVNIGGNFKLGNYNFKLNYVDANNIYVSFKPKYNFEDFLVDTVQQGRFNPPGKANGQNYYPQVCPVDSCPVTNARRILVNASFSSPKAELPAVILNETAIGRAAWMADIADKNKLTSDDEKQLLISLLVWASNKHYISGLSNLRLGHLTSYLNVVNQDMYEVYEFDLGLGFPF